MRAATSLAAFLKTEFRNSCRLRSPGSGRSPASGCCTVSSGTRGSDRTTREPWSIVSSCSSGTARCCGRPPCSRLTSSGTQNWFHFYQIGWIGIDTNETNVRLCIFSEIRQWHIQNTFFLVIQIRYSFKCFYYSFRYVVGPLPKVVCQINYFMKLHFTIHSLILLDFIAVTRD